LREKAQENGLLNLVDDQNKDMQLHGA